MCEQECEQQREKHIKIGSSNGAWAPLIRDRKRLNRKRKNRGWEFQQGLGTPNQRPLEAPLGTTLYALGPFLKLLRRIQGLFGESETRLIKYGLNKPPKQACIISILGSRDPLKVRQVVPTTCSEGMGRPQNKPKTKKKKHGIIENLKNDDHLEGNA